MASASDNALIVQSDCSVLLDVHSTRAGAARAALAPFGELVTSPEHVHTYRVTPLSIWNAADLQARRRLGLTATLVREDGREGDVFTLIFTLVSRDTREEEFAHHRKLFLTEQGYSYRVVIAGER